jgi:hypothetical protein
VSESYDWRQVRDVLLHLGFIEIITPDDNVLFFQNPEKGLVKLRKYDIDTKQLEIISEIIKFLFDEFIKLCEKAKKHQFK